MQNYSFEEIADILFCYGLADGNTRKAERLYRERFPNRRCPGRQMFSKMYQRIREGSIFTKTRERAINIHHEEAILDILGNNPNISTRKLSQQLNVSKTKVWKILKKNNLYPYRYTRVQELLTADLPKRVQFCQTLLLRDVEDPLFLKSVLWTDESQFTKNGITNFHNLHEWSHENPYNKKTTSFQRRFSVNVWAGVIQNTLIGPKIIPERLNSQSYLEFLQQTNPEILDNVPLTVRNRVIYQQDGAPPHFGRQVTDWLNNNYSERWIGRGGPIEWPARSPDLTPLDFYLWGFMKDYVYIVEIETREQLIQRILDSGEVIRTNLRRFNLCDAIRSRAHKCLLMNGGHFEHMKL